jgi:hypothetical protein
LSKRIVTLFALIVAAALLGALTFWLSRETPEAAAPSAASDPPAYITEGAVRSIAVRNAEGAFTVYAGEEGPAIAGMEGFPLDTAALSSLLSRLSRLRSEGLLEEVQSREPFGLDTPRAVLSVELEDGTRRELLIGSDAPDGRNIYVDAGEAGTVRLAASYDLRDFLRWDLDFVDKAVSPALPDSQGEAPLEGIELGGQVRGKEPVTLVYREQTGGAILAASPYRITAPIDAGLHNERGMKVLEALFGIQAEGAAALSPDAAALARYGLDRPYSTARVWGTLGNGLGGFSLRASAPDGEGRVYLMRDGLDIVFTARAAQLPWLDRGFFDLMERMIILPHIDRVAGVDIARSGANTVTFALSGEGDELTVTSGGTAVDTAIFRTFYQTLLSAMYDEYHDAPLPARAAPQAEFVYRYREAGKSPDRVSFYTGTSRRMLVSLNGGRPFFVYTAYLDKALADCALVLEGKKVLPYL